jgi:hypothetical protein
MKKFVAIHLNYETESVALHYFQIAEAGLGINPLGYLNTKFMTRKIVKDLKIDIKDYSGQYEKLIFQEVPDLSTITTV